MGLTYYVRVFRSFMSSCVAREVDYRASVVGDLLDSLLNVGISILLFDIIYSNVSVVSGWTRYQALLLVGYAQLVTSVLFILFMNNLPRIQTYVMKGEMDFILAKPCDSQFYVSLRYINFGGLSSLFPSLGLMALAAARLGIHLSLGLALVFMILLVLSVALGYSIWLILMTLSFYFYRISQVHELFLSLLTFMQYPSQIYKGIIRILLVYLIPIVSISNIPVGFLLSQLSVWSIAAYVLITAFFFAAARAFWSFSVRHYQSASS